MREEGESAGLSALPTGRQASGAQAGVEQDRSGSPESSGLGSAKAASATESRSGGGALKEFSAATREILAENLANTRSAIEEIRENLETIEAGRRRAEAKVVELAAELELERSERQRSQRDRTVLAQRLDELERRLAEADASSEELDKTRRRVSELARERDQLQHELAAARERITSLEAEVREITTSAERDLARINELAAEVEAACVSAAQRHDEMTTELDTEREKANTLERHLKETAAAKEKMTAELDAARAAYDHLSAELSEARSDGNGEKEKLKTDLETARTELEDSEKKIVELQAQLEAVDQSREVANLDLMIARKAIEELRASLAV